MKVYYIRIEDADFTKTLSSWESPVIDVYDNDTYKNYCTAKPGYGTNLLGDGTWTGMEAISPTETEAGYVVGDRFVDTTAPVNVISYTFEGDPSIDGLVAYTLDVLATDFNDATPSWSFPAMGVAVSDNINVTDVDRYLKFVINFNNAVSFPYSGTLLVRVEVDEPVMAPFYRRTRKLLDKLPEWMEMREIDNISATPTMAMPTSLGGAFVNAAGGEWLESIANDLVYIDLQKYVTTVDLNQVAWVWRRDHADQYVWSVVGDSVELSQAYSLAEFYAAADDDDIYFWDEPTRSVYVRKHYTSLVLNEAQDATPPGLAPHHVWNWIDDIGLLVDLDRLLLEENLSFQLRIMDVHKNRPGVGVENFKRTLRRELNIWSVYGSTPNSDYLGATPVVLEVSDIEADPVYVAPDGMPTTKFIKLANKLALDYPTTWGYFFWNQAFWDFGGPNHEGYSTLPQRYDATPLMDEDTQSGVGHGNDLYIYRPDAVTGPHQFDATLKVRGRERTWRTEYTEAKLALEVFGRADKDIYTNETRSIPLSILIETSSGEYFYNITLDTTNNASAENPTGTDESWTVFDFFDDDGQARTFADIETGVLTLDHATPFTIAVEDVIQYTLCTGHYDVDSQTLVDAETDDVYEAWLHIDDAATVDSSTDTAEVTPTDVEARIILRNKVIDMTPGKWESEHFNYTVTMNGALPDQTEQSYVLDLPTIVWDPFLDASPTMEYVVRVISTNGDATPVVGGFAFDDDDEEFFVPLSYFYVEGSNSWTDDIMVFSAALDTLEFTTGDGGEATPVYPIQGSVWTLFERSQLAPFVGIVDENGPWRNNVPPQPGNVNFGWKSADMERVDFNIPNNTNFVPTWIGVEASDPQVIIWLDNNTIIPYSDIETTINYPANAISEYLDGGLYGFENFMIRARLRPDPAPQWNPQVNAGWFYEQQQEYYLYAARAEAVVTGASSVILDGVAHQGAPIIVYTDEATPRLIRQVAASDATPQLGLTQTQVLPGNGTDTLYLAHPDVYDIEVTEYYSGDAVAAPSSVAGNEVQVGVTTDRDILYKVTYILNGSFYAEMNYESNNQKRTRLTFDQADDYVVSYEASIFNPATPVDLPLSPLYTSLEEGFLFVSHREYDLGGVELYLSPPKVVADGADYIQITIRSVDGYSNPKGNQTFSISTTFGTLDHASVTTDRDGFASVLLTSSSTPPANNLAGTVTVTNGDMNVQTTFGVDLVDPQKDTLLAVPSSEEIPADARSQVTVFGKLEDTDFEPRANTTVYYRRGRSLFELFQSSFLGSAVTNANGEFSVGPFTAATPTSPGYWFLSVETDPATPSRHVGDVVFWNEYATNAYGIDDLSGLPRPSIQMATPVTGIPPYAVTYQFPYSYEEDYEVPPNVVNIDWLPPKWYSMPWYLQYQLGLLGATPNHLAPDYLTDARPPRREM